MTDETYTTEERRWLEVWDDKREKVSTGAMTVEEVLDWTWKNKVLNAINVTIQRIKRSHKPGLDPRRHDNTWVTLAAERGQKREDISALAIQALAHVYRRLKERGHDFDVDWMASVNGVVVISVNVKSLREYMKRRAAAGGEQTAEE